MEFNGCLLGQLLLHTKSQPGKFPGKPGITKDTLRVPIFLDRTFLRHYFIRSIATVFTRENH